MRGSARGDPEGQTKTGVLEVKAIPAPFFDQKRGMRIAFFCHNYGKLGGTILKRSSKKIPETLHVANAMICDEYPIQILVKAPSYT